MFVKGHQEAGVDVEVMPYL